MSKQENNMDAVLAIRDLTVEYGTVKALNNVSLMVPAGEFITLLGPSGSGKSTLLMAIAGFVPPAKGQIWLGGRELSGLPAEQRNFGVVFQGYALFPHMTVAQNVAFPLLVRGVGAADREKRVREVLDLVRMGGFADRKPGQLSGGQQQRVALARAIVFGPGIVLLDEPMSALDRQLREQMQFELKELHKRVGCTFIMVTHDQSEALAMSDRVAILDKGLLLQTGAPREVYDRPASRFVAEFLGKNNFIPGKATRAGNGSWRVATSIGCFTHRGAGLEPAEGQEILLAVRPECWRPRKRGSAAPGNCVTGKVIDVSFLGKNQQVVFRVGDIGEMSADFEVDDADMIKVGDEVSFGWPEQKSVLIPKE